MIVPLVRGLSHRPMLLPPLLQTAAPHKQERRRRQLLVESLQSTSRRKVVIIEQRLEKMRHWTSVLLASEESHGGTSARSKALLPFMLALCQDDHEPPSVPLCRTHGKGTVGHTAGDDKCSRGVEGRWMDATTHASGTGPRL